jgi:glycosyltransferase involved in cell wall biosynthesis
MIKVSIICPTYNEEKYIEKCIKSIISQNFSKEQFEVLFIDGGSSDSTVNIIKKFQKKYSFIKLLNNPNKIVPYAMNIGIRAALGSIVIRIDAHSLYPENYVKVLVANLIKMNADNVGAICETDVLNKNKKTLAIKEVLINPFGVGNSLFRIGVNEITEVDTVPFGCYKKEVFYKHGMYNINLVRNQDIELNKRIKRGGGKIYLIPEISCTYYAREKFIEIIKNNFQNGKWNILTVYFTKVFDSLSIRHFIPLLFFLSLFIPLFLSILYLKLILITMITLVAYFVVLTVVSLRISLNKKINFIYLFLAFIFLHISYGFGSFIGILSLPFQKIKKYVY